MTTVADSVTLRYEGADSETVIEALTTRSYRRFLRETRGGSVAVGDEWDEVVNDGCGRTRSISLHVEAVSGGSAVGSGTDIRFVDQDGR